MMKIHIDKEQPFKGMSGLKMVAFFLVYFVIWYGLIPFLNLVSSYYLYSDYMPLVMGLPLLIGLLPFPSIRERVIVAFSLNELKQYKIYIILIVGFFFILFSERIIFLNGIFISDQLRVIYENNLFLATKPLIWYLFIIFFTPIFEEVFYRVILFGWLNHKCGVWVGAIGSSTVFGWFHGDYPIFAGIMGLIYLYVYRYSKTIIPAIILHAIWNTFIFFREYF